MVRTRTIEKLIWIITPFERPDVGLARASGKAGAFPILHLGRERIEAEDALAALASTEKEFGVCFAGSALPGLELPNQATIAILPWGSEPPETGNAEIVWQVQSFEETEAAIESKVNTLILKGCESAGQCGGESAFILFQKSIAACAAAGVDVIIQGGVGVHTAAAYMALGAAGVALDSQVALFPECGLSQAVKSTLGKLSGNEIRDFKGYHYYIIPGSNMPGDIADPDELYSRIVEAESDILPLGQDVILAPDLADEYQMLKGFMRALKRSMTTHVKQARIKDAFSPNGASAKALGTVYPIAQGPMARISDMPDFLNSVADGGALPFLAMSMMTGKAASDALAGAAAALGDKPWGVGILGFTYPNILEEQIRLITETRPPFVLIAGGRPSQAKIFEQAGIKVLLHAPTPGLLDMFLKEGARGYVFEGRESGGHVGPLYSSVLWEKQITRILRLNNPSNLCVFFAGGIHNALSAAFVRVISGPLAARGVNVCLLCGTAYLYTEEAVRHGAITNVYQKQLIEKTGTILLKSGGGQETRCIQSPFTDFFSGEKARFENEGLEPAKILTQLEELNLGRLRIASKGLERIDGAYVKLADDAQIEKGLFMTGAVTALIGKSTTVADLHADIISGSLRLLEAVELPKSIYPKPSPSNIAVIGMAGIFPKAADLDEFWSNIVFGKDCITEVPNERWSTELFFDPEAKDTDFVPSKWGGFLDLTDFNVMEFGITPQSLSSIEPVQLLSLLVAKRALEDAGFSDLQRADFSNTSVIFGAEGGGELSTAYGSRYGVKRMLGYLPDEAANTLPRLTEDSFPGVLGNVIAGRISNRLNTGGRNYVVDAACASSLAALDIALSELDGKKADMVILGGADLHNGINEYLMFASTHALSPKGRCATFDENADGTTLGEGVAAVVLKRLEDAIEDGNKIYAVIKSTGGSSDGKNLSLTAPSKRGQIRAIDLAYSNAGVRPSDIGLVEAHGTGTIVGDLQELRALTEVYLEDGTKPRSTALGALKTQIGHAKCAAGIAGLIKVIHCVRHGYLPPTLNLTKPIENYIENSPFRFYTDKAAYWRGEHRIAALSAFGFGGTNFHAVVENYGPTRPEAPIRAWPAELFVFVGETERDAFILMDKIAELYYINDALRLRDVAYSLALKHGAVQYSIVAGSWGELLDRIDKARNGIDDDCIFKLKPVAGKVAFLFSGQGGQRVNMAADLFLVYPRMRRLLNDRPEYERVLFPESVFTDAEKKEQRRAITDTRNAQPLLGIVDLAIAELLREFGVEPDMVAGHSYGELPALCFAGVFKPEKLTDMSRARAEATLNAVGDDPGRMAAVSADASRADVLKKLLDGFDDVWAVNYNSPKQTAVAATSGGMDVFLAKAKEAGFACSELNVACAFHSPLLKGADENFAAALGDIEFHAPQLPVWSNTIAEPYPQNADDIKRLLASHLVSPVRFTDEIKKMSEAGAAVFIETGPGGTLVKFASDILSGDGIATIQTERNGAGGLTYFLQGLAKYLATGRPVNLSKLFEGREAAGINIDEPSLNKKAGIIWKVNGSAAFPENGELPAYMKEWPKTTIMREEDIDMASKNEDNRTVESGDQKIVLSYLDNINALIQDQRDVILSYFGSEDIAPRVSPRGRRVRRTGREYDEESDYGLLDEEFADTDGVDYYDDDTGDIDNIDDIDAEYATSGVNGIDGSGEESEGSEGNEAVGINETSVINNGLPEIASLDSNQIENIVFEVVSEKTGYPVDMLNPDMDLEADLSIDSIKKMEIIGGLRERIQFPESNENMEAFFERMISIGKFADLFDWVKEIGKAAAGGEALEDTTTGFEEAQLVADLDDIMLSRLREPIQETYTAVAVETEDGAATPGSLEILRMTLTEMQRPIADNDPGCLKQKYFAVTDDGSGLAADAARALEAAGASVIMISGAGNADISDCDGLILINSSSGAYKYTIMDLFNLLKSVDLDRLECAYVFDDMPGAMLESADRGSLEEHDEISKKLPEGFSGLFKSLLQEHAGKRFRAVLSETLFDPETFTDIVIGEIASCEPVSEVFYRGADRFAMYPGIGPAEADEGETAMSVLDENSVVVVLGGAQGITTRAIERLAEEVPCRYILIGRSAAEEGDEFFTGYESVAEIRKYLIEHDEVKQPREIEAKTKRLFKQSRIAASMASIKRAGAEVEYISADATDREAFTIALSDIKRKYGKIDGIVHAAGILEDKFFRHKDADSFARVYNTKVLPLKIILDELLPELKMLVIFSSMASAFGSAGQCDYAAGNNVLDIGARLLKRLCPDLKVVSFNWGPWKGAGMVNQGLENEFKKKGISLIDLDKGCEFFVTELMHGNESNVLAICGDESALSDLAPTLV